MNYTVSGTVKCIFETHTFPSGFTKRELIVTTAEDRYPQDIKFTFVKEKGEIGSDWDYAVELD